MVYRFLAVSLAFEAAAACSMMPTAGWKVTESALNGDQGLLGPERLRLELINYGGDDGYEALSTVQAVLDISTGILQSHDATMEFMAPGCRYPNFMSATAQVPQAPDGSRSGLLTNGQANVSWAKSGEYITGDGSGTEGSATFKIPGATSAVSWYSHALERLLAVYEDGSGTLGLAACVNATGTCTTTSAAQAITSIIEFNPDFGSVRVLDSERLVELPLRCCVCKSFETFVYSLDGTGELQLSPVTAINDVINGGSCYDLDANEVWVTSGATGAECDGSIYIERYDYLSGQQTANVTITASDIHQVFGGSCGRAMPGWAVALVAVCGVVGCLGVVVCGAIGAKVLMRRRGPPPKEYTANP